MGWSWMGLKFRGGWCRGLEERGEGGSREEKIVIFGIGIGIRIDVCREN